MICDIVETALIVNNSVNLTRIPYNYLTRIETLPLTSLDKLSHMKIQMNQYYQPYVPMSMEDTLKLKYQTLCDVHTRHVLNHLESNIIYVSMDHLSEAIKNEYKDFYYCDMYKQFHFVFQLHDWDDCGLNVSSVKFENQVSFLLQQDLARQQEKLFNLKYHLKEYIACPCCMPTLCGMAIFYKDTTGKLPTRLANISSDFDKALVMIKSDRMDVLNICKMAQTKWKTSDCEGYTRKMAQIGEKCKWDYNTIISFVHKINNDNNYNNNYYQKYKCNQ